MKYEIKGTPLPVVICELEAEEYLITEKGSMSWMSPNMEMDTVGGGVGKALGRMFSGEALFQNKYTAKGNKGLIAFASSFPGQIMPLDIQPGKSMIVQKSAFLAAQPSVELSIHFQKKLGAGFFGGEGFIMQKLSGQGVAFVEIDGHVVEYNLQAGQSMMIDTGY
ncbi:MAG: AIM24 family protein, partial [Oscillospiraceae bacterium]|nr:AIM24 family protein [Oscillospiraceae bacterium]